MPTNREQFERLALSVTDEMREHTVPYVASISREVSSAEGEHWASGTYLQLCDQPRLVTNEHVARGAVNYPLAHQLAANESAIRITNATDTLSYPFDLAMTRIEQRIWFGVKNERRALPVERLATKHAPVDNELLFVLGYSGQRSYFTPTFQTLIVAGTPYLTQESKSPPAWLSPMHFALPYSPERAVKMSPKGQGLPDPHGFSGAPVWNTRFHERVLENRLWTAEDSQITGVVFRWEPATAHLLAIRIEHVRSFLLNALRREAAYFHWLSRGSPLDDDLSDWLWAEKETRSLW